MSKQQLQAIRAGDAEALTAWFNANVDAVYAFVFSRVGNNADLAADATQETFRIALQRLADYDPERGEMITWLRTLSRNVVRDLMRAQKRSIAFQAVWDAIDESLVAIYESIEKDALPDSVLEQKETRELVTVTLANIQPHYRDLLEAKYLNRQSLQTIADCHTLTIDAVKARLRRARLAFKETFLLLAKTEVSA